MLLIKIKLKTVFDKSQGLGICRLSYYAEQVNIQYGEAVPYVSRLTGGLVSCDHIVRHCLSKWAGCRSNGARLRYCVAVLPSSASFIQSKRQLKNPPTEIF